MPETRRRCIAEIDAGLTYDLGGEIPRDIRFGPLPSSAPDHALPPPIRSPAG